MKKNIFFLLIIFSACTLYAEKLRVMEDTYLWLDSDYDSKIMGSLEIGTVVEGEIDSDNNDWYIVTCDMGDSGCVPKEFVERLYDTNTENNTNESIQNTNEDNSTGNEMIYTCIFLLIFAIVKIKRKINSTKCSKCNKYFAKVKIGKELLDSKGHYKTVKRIDIKRNNKGEQIGTIERKEQIHVVTNHYRVYCKCRYCGYQDNYETFETEEK